MPEGLEAEPGTGFANWTTGPAAIEYLTDAPNARIRVRVVGNEAYMDPTEQAAAGAGEQVFWVKMPFLMWRRPFYPQLTMAMDPVNQLTLATTGRLSAVGTESLDGAEVTHYRAVTVTYSAPGTAPTMTAPTRDNLRTSSDLNRFLPPSRATTGPGREAV
ncbi:hypothetical protein [Kitasatospora purpeofusca]|uniref:hypothetical protein n=1 Tax=Kitasatospora purpeofusca TaxID=67352 RepID=UPI00365D1A16